MSFQVFLVFFLLLFVCCKLCERGCAAHSVQAPAKTNENTFAGFFTKEDIKEKLQSAGVVPTGEITAIQIESVFLAAADDVMVALANVNYENENKEYINSLEKFIKITKGADWGKPVIEKKSVSDWGTQLVKKNDKYLKKENKIKSSTVVVNGKKIYNFFVTNSTFQNGVSLDSVENQQWNTALIVGDVSGANAQKVEITWEEWKLNKLPQDKTQKDVLQLKPKTIPPVVSFGFVLNKKVVFAIQGEGKETNVDKNVTAFFTLGTENNLEFLHVENTEKCFSSLVLWEEQIVMTPTACEAESKQNMRVFDYKDGFKAIDKKVNFLQEFLKDKENFVTTKINSTEDVLLFTQKKAGTNDVYLWVTNGNRTAKVDTIITEITSKFDVSILYTNKELFALHKQKKGSSAALDDTKYDLRRLPDKLTEINLILNAWKNNDNEIKKFFKKTDTAETPSFTDRLVGFLSGNGEDNQYWKDEYFYEDATVTGNGTRVDKGFMFSGKSAGAKWLVGKAIEDQPYNFADSGFTLVATVKIDNNANKKDNSVLGIEIKESIGDKKYKIGLWCNTDNKWAVSDGSNQKKILSATEKCVQGETYQVVLTMKNKHVSMYIDGKKMEELPQNLETSQKPLNIAHFYFGANITTTGSSPVTDESHVTITNVLLYNRLFNEEKEISELKKYVTIKKDTTPPNGNTTPQESQEIPTPLPQGTDKNEKSDEKEEKAPSPSRTEDGGVGGGVRVFSLLLTVLCVSAPLLHL